MTDKERIRHLRACFDAEEGLYECTKKMERLRYPKEIDREVLMKLSVQAAPSGRFADDDWMSHDSDLYRALTKNK